VIQWWRRRRARKDLARRFEDLHELREFVYLDEVSVTSLLASREGGVPKEITESQSTAFKGEVSGQANASAGVFKGQLASKWERSGGTNSQVVRQATVQTLFKLLYDLEEKDLILTSRPARTSAPPAEEKRRPRDQKAIPVTDLRRGELIEVEVEVATADIFQMTSALGTFKEIADDHESLREQIDPATMGELATMSNVVEKLLVGLIPLRCRVVNYELVDNVDGKALTARDTRISPAREARPVKPLYIVGDTEQALFWKDIRRVLFSESRFRMFCRVSSDGLRTTWSPVKLAEVLRKLDPQLGAKISLMGTIAIDAMTRSGGMHNLATTTRSAALLEYGRALAAANGIEPDENQIRELTETAAHAERFWTSIPGSRKAFEQVQDITARIVGKELDSALFTEARAKVREQFRISYDGQLINPINLADIDPKAEPEDLLEVEIIAIYW
jgi:hypothetical protein